MRRNQQFEGGGPSWFPEKRPPKGHPRQQTNTHTHTQMGVAEGRRHRPPPKKKSRGTPPHEEKPAKMHIHRLMQAANHEALSKSVVWKCHARCCECHFSGPVNISQKSWSTFFPVLHAALRILWNHPRSRPNRECPDTLKTPSRGLRHACEAQHPDFPWVAARKKPPEGLQGMAGPWQFETLGQQKEPQPGCPNSRNSNPRESFLRNSQYKICRLEFQVVNRARPLIEPWCLPQMHLRLLQSLLTHLSSDHPLFGPPPK